MINFKGSLVTETLSLRLKFQTEMVYDRHIGLKSLFQEVDIFPLLLWI